MSQFSVYRNPNAQTKKRIPYLLDIQSGMLDGLQTRVVVPLVPADKNAVKQISRLMPLLKIEGDNYLMLTPQLAGVNRSELGKAVVNLSSARNEIIAAVDFLVTGF